MSYADYLNRLLAPLGVYDLREGTVSAALTAAVGQALDEIWESLQKGLRDAFPQTADADALPAWERLTPAKPAVTSAAALTALSCHAHCTGEALNALMQACGYAAQVAMVNGALTVTGTDAAAAVDFLRPFAPAHLQVHSG